MIKDRQMYDLIGDIHGHAVPLKQLLGKMGYAERDGVWQHPERRVIFLGDFIDRGPEQIEVVRMAREMVERGHALAVMGNHEFNAVSWLIADPDQPGEFLRRHSEKNREQHAAFLDQVGEGSALHDEIVSWFKTLPLYLDLEGVRVVHACWHPASFACLSRFTDSKRCVLESAWPALNRKGTPPFDALEVILKGLEIELPAGFSFADSYGHVRRNIRTKWWELQGLTYRDLAMVPSWVIESIPHEPVPCDILPGYDGEKPLFVGHYWMSGEPRPLNEHIACLDYSIAANAPSSGVDKRKLCAYRWSGEATVLADHFISVRHPH
jgi:hypothetical protein